MSESKEYVSQTLEHGAIHISEEVIATIAALAVQDVEGVYGLNTTLSSSELSKLAKRAQQGKGIRLVISEDDEISVDCYIVVLYGHSVVDVAKAVQETVTSAVESTTGRKVKNVNVNISGITLPQNAGNACFGGGKYSCGYLDSLYIYGLDAASGESTRLAGLLDCGIDENQLTGVYLGEDGGISCFVNNFDTGNTELYHLTELDPAEAAKIVTLRLACNYVSPNLNRAVLNFNTSSKNARIEVTDYSQYATDEDYSAGITKLNTEILSGNVPDLFVTTDLPMARYAAKGLLKDIYELMDKDPELGRGSFMAPVLKAVETDGKLYSISPGFGLITLVGKSDIVGKEPGWTLAQMQEVIKAHPEAKYILGQGMTRNMVLDSMLRYGLDRYVDWQKGECSFNSPDFIDVLNFSRLFPEEFEYEDIGMSPYQLLAEGRQLLMPYELRDFRDYQTCITATKGGATFKGYPTADGIGNLITMAGDPLSISATCRNMDAAWGFVRGMLGEDYYKSARYDEEGHLQGPGDGQGRGAARRHHRLGRF